jgi:hypothetical protein
MTGVTRRRLEDLPRRRRNRLLLWSLLRSALTTICLVIVYYEIPMRGRFTPAIALGLAGGLLIVLAIVSWQAKVIARSPYPRLRAIEALAMAVPLFLLLFAAGYIVMGNSQPGAFSEPLTRTDAVYYAVTLFSTVGFGDIVPRSQPARILSMAQMFGDLFIVGVAARLLLDAVRRGLDRRSGGDTAAPGD